MKKSTLSSRNIQMIDASTETDGHFIHKFHLPIKEESPPTSNLVIKKLKEAINIVTIKYKIKPRAEAFVDSVIVKEVEEDVPIKTTRKKRGRPEKCKAPNKKLLFCGLCDFKAKNIKEQKRHLKTHSHESFFECAYCRSTFSQKGNLLTHIKTHLKDKPFKCKLCSFAAVQKINLQVHLRKHTKERPFKCKDCKFSTAQKGNLFDHINRKHSKAISKIKAEPQLK